MVYILTTSIPGKFQVDTVIPSRVKGAGIIYFADVSIILKGRYKLRGFPNLSRNISVGFHMFYIININHNCGPV